MRNTLRSTPAYMSQESAVSHIQAEADTDTSMPTSAERRPCLRASSSTALRVAAMPTRRGTLSALPPDMLALSAPLNPPDGLKHSAPSRGWRMSHASMDHRQALPDCSRAHLRMVPSITVTASHTTRT